MKFIQYKFLIMQCDKIISKLCSCYVGLAMKNLHVLWVIMYDLWLRIDVKGRRQCYFYPGPYNYDWQQHILCKLLIQCVYVVIRHGHVPSEMKGWMESFCGVAVFMCDISNEDDVCSSNNMSLGNAVCFRCGQGFAKDEEIVNSNGEIWHTQCFVWVDFWRFDYDHCLFVLAVWNCMRIEDMAWVLLTVVAVVCLCVMISFLYNVLSIVILSVNVIIMLCTDLSYSGHFIHEEGKYGFL